MKVFKESQRYNLWWLILIGLITAIVIAFIFVNEYEDSGNNLSTRQLVSFLFSGSVLVLIFLLIVFIKLETKIDENGIYYRFIPFHFKTRTILWSDLSKCYVRKYAPISEYGGWGIRGFKKKGFWDFGNRGMALNVKGNYGIQLILKDGGKLLVGTQNPEKAEMVIKNYIHKMDNTNPLDN